MAVNRYPAPSLKIVDFNSSGTWTCPTGVYSAEFMVVGAGGAGGGTTLSSASNHAAGAGGGGGAVKKVKLATIPGAFYTITIGAKGTGSSAAIGGNGGFSEIVYSGTTLVRSFGGQGGGAITAGEVITLPTVSRTIAGGGGQSPSPAAAVLSAGGGGGAVNGGSAVSTYVSATNNSLFGAEGSAGNVSSSAAAQHWASFGSGGVDGYGAGGSGGATVSSTRNYAGASYFAGVGNLQATTGYGNGTAAVANTGCGGGGGSSHTNTTSTTGGNGADGLIRIEYVA
jgi:hypothetical protein